MPTLNSEVFKDLRRARFYLAWPTQAFMWRPNPRCTEYFDSMASWPTSDRSAQRKSAATRALA